MQDSTLNKVSRVAAYIGGGALIFLGIMGSLIELSKGMPSSTHFSDYVLAAMLVMCGAFICVAVRLHYGGGLWSFWGLIFVALAITRLTFVLQVYMQNRLFTDSVTFFSMTITLWGVGCYCLLWGHMRHRRKKKTQAKSLQATAAAPASCD